MGCTATKNRLVILDPGEKKRRFSKHSSLDLDQPEEVYIPLERQLGKGKFGSVCLATSHLTHKQVAIKIQSRQNESALKSELNTIFLLDHPNIIKCQECFQDSKFYYIVSEYLPGGELITTQNQFFSELHTKKIIQKLLSAVSHMQSRHIVHRDLKPENILLDSSGEIKIIDFGLSSIYKQGVTLKDVVGTPQYMAPEILTCEYGPDCDLWSVGVIMHTMLVGRPPSLGVGKDEILRRLSTGKFEIEAGKLNVSLEAQMLLGRLLEKNPSKRIKAKEALEHLWFLDKGKNVVSEVRIEKMEKGEKFLVLHAGMMGVEDEDLRVARKEFEEMDKGMRGIVEVLVKGKVEEMGFGEFMVTVLKEKILEKGIPLLYQWCLKDGKFSLAELRKCLNRRGKYVSSTVFTQEFESLQDFQRFLSE